MADSIPTGNRKAKCASRWEHTFLCYDRSDSHPPCCLNTADVSLLDARGLPVTQSVVRALLEASEFIMAASVCCLNLVVWAAMAAKASRLPEPHTDSGTQCAAYNCSVTAAGSCPTPAPCCCAAKR